VRASPLTEDHRPSAPKEKQRVLAAGGRVFGVRYDDGSAGGDRVWLQTVDVPGLLTARSLGDTVGAEFAGVSSVPFVRSVPLEGDSDHPSLADVGAGPTGQRLGEGGKARGDGILIVATDGLWDMVTRYPERGSEEERTCAPHHDDAPNCQLPFRHTSAIDCHTAPDLLAPFLAS
jgi:serine/threonine protein phosphatase PrpC